MSVEAQAPPVSYLSRSHTNLPTVILPGYNTLGIRVVSTKSLSPSACPRSVVRWGC